MTAISTDLSALRALLNGEAFGRDDLGYRDAVSGYNSVAPVNPDIVVVAESENDVAEAVRFARSRQLRVTVMCTGHGSYAPIPDGLLVRTKLLTAVEVDDASGIARLGAGVIWRDALPIFRQHGLTAITGSSPSVGAIGLALGGGMGPLSRSYGYTADWVTGFRVVRADGEVVVADAEQNADLYWALRGGKGGLGIVTEMSIQLIDLPTVYGGGLYWTGAGIADIYRFWVAWADTRPEAVNSSVNLLRLPDIPEIPEPLRGEVALHLRFVYTERDITDDELRQRGEAELAPFRQFATPAIDTIDLLSSAEIGTVHADPEGPLPIWERGHLLEAIDDTFVDALLAEVGHGIDAPFIAVEVRCLGGRIREAATDSAIGGRAAGYALLLVGIPDVSLFSTAIPQSADRLIERIAPWVSRLNTYNWAGHPSTDAAFAACWDETTHARLTALRSTHDPDRVFSFGPAGARQR